MRLSDADIRRIAVALADELETRQFSVSGIGAPVKGDRCDEVTEKESMDHTHTGNDGELSSPEQIAARLLSRSRQKQKRKLLPMQPERRAKAGR